ncbi:BMP family ABC transporter substrate-binding protein [Novispirillum itersonii subsp. nipponicum]
MGAALVMAGTVPLLAGWAPARAAAPVFAPAVVLSVGAVPVPPPPGGVRYTPEPSFNDTIRRGAERFSTETGVAVRTVIDDASRDAADILREQIRQGATLIVAVAGAHRHAAAVEAVAAEFPQVRFVLLDAEVRQPNVTSIVFREQQAAYLAGVVAAGLSRSGTIGFIGGMDNPVIRRFRCGYETGARSINPGISVLGSYVDVSSSGFRAPEKAARLALMQIDRGADVLFAAAGRSGIGVLDEAAERGKYSIGVDANQNGRHPGMVLTSAVKRVDIAVYRALRDGRDGTLRGGVQALGLAEDAVGIAQDENNALVVPEPVWDQVDAARTAILSGQAGGLEKCD